MKLLASNLYGCEMKIELDLPAGTRLYGVYLRGDGWGAIVSCTPGVWPSKYHQTFADMRPPGEPKYHQCSGASAGCPTAQAAIDLAYEKMVLNMQMLDGITRAAPAVKEKVLDPSVLKGLDLGSLDL